MMRESGKSPNSQDFKRKSDFCSKCIQLIFPYSDSMYLTSVIGEKLTSCLSCVLWFILIFLTFPYGVLDQVWYLIVFIPDLCFPLYHDNTFPVSCHPLEYRYLDSNKMCWKFLLHQAQSHKVVWHISLSM